MLRRANDLTARARERIRAGREHDPHALAASADDDRAILVRERATPRARPTLDDAPGPGRAPHERRRRTARRWAAPSPAPRTSTARRPGGVSGPPPGGRPHRPPASAPAPAADRRTPRRAAEAGVPNGLRTAAAWSWRLIVVGRRLLRAAPRGRLRRGRRRPGASSRCCSPRCCSPAPPAWSGGGWPRSLAAFTMLLVGLGVVAGIITLVVERFMRRLRRPRRPGQPGHRPGAALRRPHLPDHPGPARRRRRPVPAERWSTTRARSPPGP